MTDPAEDPIDGVPRRLMPVLWAILAVLAIGVVVLSITYFHLHDRAVDNRSQIEHINDVLVNQKVCTDSHPEACPALFDRLANTLTAGQRRRLACDVLAAMKQEPIIWKLRKDSECPVAIVPPRP